MLYKIRDLIVVENNFPNLSNGFSFSLVLVIVTTGYKEKGIIIKLLIYSF